MLNPIGDVMPRLRVISLLVIFGSSSARWGIPIMTALALAIIQSANTCRDCTIFTDDEKLAAVSTLAFSGACYGAGIGALIGRERWNEFDLAPRVSKGVTESRPAVGFSVEF